MRLLASAKIRGAAPKGVARERGPRAGAIVAIRVALDEDGVISDGDYPDDIQRRHELVECPGAARMGIAL
jgi:hypothetical protein